MKKFIKAIIVGIITIGLTACGGNEGSESLSVATTASLPTVESSNTQTGESTSDVKIPETQSSVTEESIIEEDETQFIGFVDDGIFVLEDVISEAEEILVPDSISGAPVGKIGKEAFYNLKCKKITIPDTVTSIGKCAFLECVNLETIELGSGIKTVGSLAFQSCLKLKKVSFSEGLETIKGNLFYDNSELGEVYIPASAKEIENGLGDIVTCPNLVIVTPSGSRAEEVAIAEKIPVRN